MNTKECLKCKIIKEQGDYYKNSGKYRGGYQAVCKQCQKEYKADWNRKNKARQVERASRYYEENKEKLKISRDAYYSKNKEREYLKLLTRSKEHPKVYKARWVVSNRKRCGSLVAKPCEACGSEKVEAHHCDYNKPLEVMWLCRKHHVKWHQLFTPIFGLLLCVFVSGCSQTRPIRQINSQMQVYKNQYIVNQGALVAAGLACEWEPGTKSCKLIQAGDRYDIQAGKWTSAALVQVSGEDVVAVQSEIVPYSPENDKCLTNSKLSKIECSPNYVVHITGKPNDPLYEDALFKQHGARRWISHPRPTGPIVAVIDTGVDYNHEDLTGKVVGCYNAITDKDGDCYDDNGHGSHCASIISSNRDNGVGISGICSNCGIFAVKFLSASGSGSLYHAIRAIDWAVAHGARVLSNSWGGGGYSEPLKQAIERARAKGILFIGAAGNNGASFANYPAMYPLDNVVSVAAVDEKDKLTSFSNYGEGVDIAARGYQVNAARAGGGYVRLSGTSMAAPFVAGAAGAIYTKHPSASYGEVIQRLKRVRRTNRLKDKVGWRGVLNLAKGLR